MSLEANPGHRFKLLVFDSLILILIVLFTIISTIIMSVTFIYINVEVSTNSLCDKAFWAAKFKLCELQSRSLKR